MHKHFMECYGNYLINNYSNLAEMSHKQLCEAMEIAEVMKVIFSADKEYNIVESMAEHKNEAVEMNIDEFLIRAKKMYSSCDEECKLRIAACLEELTK